MDPRVISAVREKHVGPEHKDAPDQPGDIGKFTDKGTFEGDIEGWVCTFSQKRGLGYSRQRGKYKKKGWP